MSLIGRQIGRYRILEQLGSGGMSVVYRGLDTALDREVAVKVLHPHLAQKPESRMRLAREAKAVAKLHHPNIVEVFDFSVGEGGDAFLVTELIPGQTLRAYQDQERFDPPELAAMVVHEIAAALAHAHEAGVIHRDLKPENVMVRRDGVLKLMDFGIAKIIDRDDRMTQTGALVGSPAHMAPEVIEGEEVGPEADVFSLGTMLYAFATGTLPFTGPSTTATLKRILDGEYVDPRQRSPAISDDLAQIVATCLARDPGARYPSAIELRDALADHLAGFGIERVHEELATFFADPAGYRPRLTARIVERMLAHAEEAIREGRPSRAIASLNPLLALDPEHARAQSLLARIGRQRRKRRWIRRGAAALGGLLAVAGAGAGARHLWPAHVRLATRTAAPPGSRPMRAGIDSNTIASPSEPAHASGMTTAPFRPAPSTPPGSLREPSRPPVRPAPARPVAKTVTASIGHRDLLDAAPRPAPLPAQVLVRPYGFIQIDGGPISAQALAQHDVLLTPGRHRIEITCEFCEPTEETITVRAGGDNVFRLPAELKPSRVAFDYQPADATVELPGVGARTAAQSAQIPFEVHSPRGPASFQHQVTYEIRREGYATERKTVLIPAGQTVVLHGKLRPE